MSGLLTLGGGWGHQFIGELSGLLTLGAVWFVGELMVSGLLTLEVAELISCVGELSSTWSTVVRGGIVHQFVGELSGLLTLGAAWFVGELMVIGLLTLRVAESITLLGN